MDALFFVVTAAAYRYSLRGAQQRDRSSSSNAMNSKLLEKQNAETSSTLIEMYANSEEFRKLAAYEGKLTTDRDEQDGIKLQKGIDFAKQKGVLDPNYKPDPYKAIDVLGKTPDEVAEIIVKTVKEKKAASSFVICLVGLSGTGKGTTVSKLVEKYEAAGKTVMTWSNGNLFRAVTLLAATWCQQQNPPVKDIEKACTKENLSKFLHMLSFDEYFGKFDTRIHGLGLDYYVSAVQNTELKSPLVSKNIPTVAQYTQGEVILFAASAMKTLLSGQPNTVVLLEGREQTVNYVPTPHRFCLTLSDQSLIGKRRAAQRLMAAAHEKLQKDGVKNASGAAIQAALDEALKAMVQDIEK